tara:strand:- start:1308 stop:1532 length:225 start_codon:yes stop_codon:yes gene_type:complete
MVQLGGSIKNTGRFVPQRNILTPIRSAVLDKGIDKLLLIPDDVKAVFVIKVKLTQRSDRHLNSRTLRKTVQLLQ